MTPNPETAAPRAGLSEAAYRRLREISDGRAYSVSEKRSPMRELLRAGLVDPLHTVMGGRFLRINATGRAALSDRSKARGHSDADHASSAAEGAGHGE